ncbi:uncharacterized protein LOC131284278 [Anopheles ziemanni]|uniref:uncharacterized protein LOC131272314 n=1 Tax=Anopheles coustani TaxID=139045 RepID=UPI002657E556|nr:uncharacterized protein LOC131272314 [Anopheles coustani]XP_058169115.1 uncharacterized protein LOC131284278 [Anopheles ziemanni]
MEFYRPLFRLLTCCYLVQLGTSLPFTFPDGSNSRSVNSDRSRDRTSSPEVTQSRRPEFFEGRSIRGNGPSSNRNQQFPDIYSRYQVHEDETDPPGVRPTVGPFLTNRPPSITPPPQYTTRSDRPNAAYNRLPPSKNDEPIQAEPTADDDYEDDDEDVGEEGEQPDKPVPVPAAISRPPVPVGGGGGATFNNLFYSFNDKFGGLGGLFGESSGRHKFKYKRRKPGQPCIPYDLFHKLKYGRDLQGNAVDPKTLLPNLNLILADLNYYSPNNNYGGGGGHLSDTGAGGAVFNNHYYDAVGGYPCQGVSFGGGGGGGGHGGLFGGFPHKPFKPHRPHGGPLGFFGQGGLFDWVSSADQVQGDEGVGEGGAATGGNRPAVVFNLNDAIDTVATNWKPGESFEMMMKVIANFITQVAGGAAAPVADVATDVGKINREFFSLFG